MDIMEHIVNMEKKPDTVTQSSASYIKKNTLVECNSGQI